MNLQFKGTRYEPTPDIITQAQKQLLPLARFIDESRAQAFALLELERAVGNQNQGDVWRAELTIDHEGEQYRVESTKAKLDHAVTTIARDMKQVLRKTKGKNEALLKRGGTAIKEFLRGFKSK
jgi:hypothetical protein